MNIFTRRAILAVSAASLLAASACSNGLGSGGADRIDARVDATLDYLYSTKPETRSIADKSAGVLVMPLVTKASLGVGGAFGVGALRIGDVTVDYYSAAQASFGIQIGAQQYAHALFFMTEEALLDFRRSPGWAAGADVEYAIPDQGQSLGTETTSILSPVIAYVFGQAGLRIGATLEGVKYTRIIP